MSKNDYVVIMAGGAGTRFWPLSTSKKPKQFLDILGTGYTLIQDTYNRALNICDKNNIFVVTNKDYYNLTKQQLPNLPEKNILLEPYRKNTAPCIAYAAYKIREINPNAVMVVLPSDHIIKKEKIFAKAIQSCTSKANKQDALITIGIKPSRPDTGYGYIQYITDSNINEKDNRTFKVKTFTEKPDLEMARYFVKSGEFLWNAGIFIWSVKNIIYALETHDSELASIFQEGKDIYNTNNEAKFLEKAYSTCKNISIDYSVLEKAQNVYVRSTIMGWSDVGTWRSLYEHLHYDSHKNAVAGKNVMLYDSSKCLINVPNEKLVVIQGMEDFIIIESDNMLLICKKDAEQQIRNFVNEIKIQKGDKYI